MENTMDSILQPKQVGLHCEDVSSYRGATWDSHNFLVVALAKQRTLIYKKDIGKRDGISEIKKNRIK